MKIQVLKNKFIIESKAFKIFYDNMNKLVDCEIIEKIIDEEDTYYIVHDCFDLDHFDDKILSRTMLLNIPSPSVEERLSKYKVAGVVESRVYFQNFGSIFGLKEVIDFEIFRKGLFNYGEEYGYGNYLKKEEIEDYTLVNMIVDYLKMHKDYFKR